MTQAATQITLSLAERVRDWSRQERDLAMAIRGLQVTPASSPATTWVPSQNFAHSVSLPSPLVVEEPIYWTGPNAEVAPDLSNEPESRDVMPHGVSSFGADLPQVVPVAPAVFGPEVGGHTTLPFTAEPVVPNRPTAPPGPFDEFIAALTDAPTGPLAPMAPLPPPARFMVRVAPVGQPHRTTKRNYDYFEELNAKLAAQATARLEGGQAE